MKTHRLKAGATFLFVLFTAAAQQPQQPAQPAPDNAKPPEKCSIEGQAVNAVTGEPIKKAQITMRSITGGVGSSTSTDTSGHFAMKDIDAGRYTLGAMRTGYVQQQYGARGPGRSGTMITLTAGQKLGDLNFRLTPHSVITGKIVDEDGDPVANVSVQIMHYRFQNGKKMLFPAGGSQTNDLGEYRIFGVAPGRYFLTAIDRRNMMISDVVDRTAAPAGVQPQPEETYAATYYPGTTDPLIAVQIDVPMGAQARGIDFTLQKVRTVRVRGRLVNSMGRGRQNMTRVFLLPRDSRLMAFLIDSPSTLIRDAQGTFEIRGVAPGSYYLSAVYYAEDNKRYTARMPLEVGKETIDSISLVIGPGNDLPGRVRLDGTGDVNFADLHVALQSRDNQFMGTPAASVKDDGSFTIQNVGPEDQTIRVFGFPENFYVKSIRMGTEEVLDSDISVARSGPAALEVVISPNGGQVEGVVTDSKDQPSTGATVALVPEPSRREQSNRYKTIATDQNGHFKLSGISPGEYQLFAWEDVEPGAYMDPDFLKSVEKRGEAISIKESSHEVKPLKVIPAEESARAAN